MNTHAVRNLPASLVVIAALVACSDKNGGQETAKIEQDSVAVAPAATAVSEPPEAAPSIPATEPAPASASALQQTPEEIMTQIYLGQAYPSGNVYLRSFAANEDVAFDWPEEVTYRSLTSTHQYASALRHASFDHLMHDSSREIRPGVTQQETAYIPALEEMDASHEGCTASFYNPKNPAFEYLGEHRDFFQQMLFNCNSNEGVAVYNIAEKSKFSFPVLAFHKRLALSEIQLSSGTMRPLTPEEAEIVAEVHAAAEEDSECTTVPNQIDSAKMFMSARVGDSDMSIRVSSYVDPGCGGHVSEIFILDVMQAGTLLEKYALSQYQGGV